MAPMVLPTRSCQNTDTVEKSYIKHFKNHAKHANDLYCNEEGLFEIIVDFQRLIKRMNLTVHHANIMGHLRYKLKLILQKTNLSVKIR